MRSTEDQQEYCGAVILAARNCGIWLGYFTHQGKHRYVWNDPMTQRFVEGPIADEKKYALELACESLIGYLNEKPHGQQKPPQVNGNQP